jgi:DNA polymerase III alpha subunit
LSVKGISDKSIEKVNKFRNAYANKFEIFEAAQQAKLPIGILSALIQAGALEGFKEARSMVVLEAQLWNILTVRERKYAFQLGEKHEFNLVNVIKSLNTFTDDKGKPVIKDSRMETIKRKYEPYKKIYLLNSKSEEFANWFYENRLLGYTVGKKLRDIFIEKCPDLDFIRTIADYKPKTEVYFIGRIKESKSGVSKNKNKYIRFTISDETGDMTVLITNYVGKRDGKLVDKIGDCIERNGGKLPAEENIVIVKGQKTEDAVFAEIVAVQNQKIYTKLSELKGGEKEEEKLEEVPVSQ